MRRVLMVACIACLAIAGIAWASSGRVVVNGRPLEGIRVHVIDGEVVASVEGLARALGCEVRREGDTVYITTGAQGAGTPAPAETGWRVVKRWTGSGIKQTEKFEVTSNEWRVSWSATAAGKLQGLLVITVYDEKGEVAAFAANQQGPGAGNSYIHAGPGRYYLDINSFGLDWTITVEEPS